MAKNTHDYPVSEKTQVFCQNGCGCFIGVHADGGPEGIDPRGKCPIVETDLSQSTAFLRNLFPAFN